MKLHTLNIFFIICTIAVIIIMCVNIAIKVINYKKILTSLPLKSIVFFTSFKYIIVFIIMLLVYLLMKKYFVQ
jgi:hypothetical protein